MDCPSCHKANPEGNRFCISCGSPLPPPGAPLSPPEPVQPTGDISQQLQALQDEVRRLRADLVFMNDRLATLERVQGIPTTPPRQQRPVPVAAPAPPSPPGEDMFGKVSEWDWEQILGGNWLARVGVLALIIGVGFFLKMAFDNDWIGPTGRVVLGILAGLTMLGGGQYWWKKYPAYAQAITGGGIALLYLSIFAAFAIFDLIGLYPAVGLLLMISVASAGLALRYESMSLAIIGILGAFGAPFVLGGFAPEAREAVQGGQSFQLLAYVMGVDLGVLALSTFRNWRWFTLLALIGSLAAFGAWFGQYGDEVTLFTSQGGLTIIFLIFVGATTLFHIVWRRAPQAFDQVLMIINAAAYFGISYGLLWEDFRAWMGGFSILLALFYGGLAYLALRRSKENVRLSLLALGIALVFLTVAIPVQLGDRAWTTIAWAAEGSVLMWLSFNLRMPQLRIFSYSVFAIVVVRLVFFDTLVDIRTFRPILNERFLAFLVSIAAMYLSAYLLRREKEALSKWEQDSWSIYPIFLLAANLFSLWLLSAEIINYFDSWEMRNAQNLSLTALWAFYAIVLLVVGIATRSRPVRVAALGLLVVPVAKVFVYDVFTLERVYRVAAFIGLGVLLLTGGYLYQRYSKAIRGFLLAK